MFEYGVPPPRIVNSAVRRKASASTEQVKGDALPGPSTCRTQDDALQCLASGDKPPERNDQFAASATIMVLRVPLRLSAVRAPLFGPGDHDGADLARRVPPGSAADRRADRLRHPPARSRSL